MVVLTAEALEHIPGMDLELVKPEEVSHLSSLAVLEAVEEAAATTAIAVNGLLRTPFIEAGRAKARHRVKKGQEDFVTPFGQTRICP